MFHRAKVSLIFPAYNEAPNIVQAIKDFQKLKIVDEILVIDNNSSDQTAALAKKAGAKVVAEKNQGYGFALIKGLSAAEGKYIVLAEPDGTFSASDLPRLLAQTKIADVVLGTRTNRGFIREGANMTWLLRTGNYVLARLLQLLFRTPRLTDCGCTYRVFKREVVTRTLPYLTIGSSHFLPQTVIMAQVFGYSLNEIPVKYYPRVGISKITGSPVKSVKVGTAMLMLIVGLWYRHYFAHSLVIEKRGES